MTIAEKAERRVNCLIMGLSLSEADSLQHEEYEALITAWNGWHRAEAEQEPQPPAAE